MSTTIVLPENFDATPVADLLRAAELARIGFDCRLLKSLVSRRDETIPALVKFSNEIHEDRLLNLEEQCFDLFRYFAAPEAVPFYIRMLRGNPADIPDSLIEAFAEIGAPALEAILDLHASADVEDRGDITFLLAAMRVVDPRVTAILERTLAEDPYEGALCIGLYGDPSLKPAVQAELEKLASGEEEVRRALDTCLKELDQARTEDDQPEFELFDLYPDISTPPFDVLPVDVVKPYLNCSSAEYRARAADSFCDDSYPDEVRDELLHLAEFDSEPKVCAAALRALGERATEKTTRKLMLDLLANESLAAEVRDGALVGLAIAGNSPEVEARILVCYESEQGRAAALEAMWRTLDPKFKKYFGPNLRSEDHRVRREAIQGVGAFPIPELAIELVPAFNDEDFRDDALFSYALAVPGTLTPKSANKFFDRIEDKAGGMTEAESEAVAIALDRRLEREGYRAHFFPDDEEDEDGGHEHHHHAPKHFDEPVRSEKIGRNDPCPCGSGKKYKKCCGAAA